MEKREKDRKDLHSIIKITKKDFKKWTEINTGNCLKKKKKIKKWEFKKMILEYVWWRQKKVREYGKIDIAIGLKKTDYVY